MACNSSVLKSQIHLLKRFFFIIIIIFTPFVKQIYINRDNRKNVEWRRVHYSKD